MAQNESGKVLQLNHSQCLSIPTQLQSFIVIGKCSIKCDRQTKVRTEKETDKDINYKSFQDL
jgi:hypothetical protein